MNKEDNKTYSGPSPPTKRVEAKSTTSSMRKRKRKHLNMHNSFFEALVAHNRRDALTALWGCFDGFAPEVICPFNLVWDTIAGGPSGGGFAQRGALLSSSCAFAWRRGLRGFL